MMLFNFIIWKVEHPSMADYYLSPGEGAAVGAIKSAPTDVRSILFISIIYAPMKVAV
jgi:hypothetical protein